MKRRWNKSIDGALAQAKYWDRKIKQAEIEGYPCPIWRANSKYFWKRYNQLTTEPPQVTT